MVVGFGPSTGQPDPEKIAFSTVHDFWLRLPAALIYLNGFPSVTTPCVLAAFPSARDVLRGSLLQRIIRHRSGCPKCDRGEGHPVAVLAVGYPGARIRQICLRKDQVAHVRHCLAKYQKLKAAIEEICEINQQLLRADPGEKESKRAR
jgi:hypothetical protein